MRKVILALILVAVILPVAVLFLRSATPVVDLPTPPTSLGQATPVAVHVQDPHGVRSAAAIVEQNGVRYQVWKLSQPTTAADSTFSFAAGVKATPHLKDGKAKRALASARAP